MTDLEFEIFKPVHTRRNVPHIIMSKNGTLIFSSKCRKDFIIPSEGFAEVAYNKENKILRIKIVENGNCQLKNWRILLLDCINILELNVLESTPLINMTTKTKFTM